MGVLDRGSDSLQAAWPGADLNWSAALAGDNRYLFVANPHPSVNSVSIYDTMTGQRLSALPGGGSPRGVAKSPDGTKVYVANLTGDSVTVMDAHSRTVLDPIPAGDGADDVAVSPGGTYLFVSNAFEDTVSAIPLGADGLPSAPPLTMAMVLAAAPEESAWGTAILSGFPAGGRVTVDGEFPRGEDFVAEGYLVQFPAGTRTLRLTCPGYVEQTISATVGPGEAVAVSGEMIPE